MAVKKSNLRLIEKLLDLGADVNARGGRQAYDFEDKLKIRGDQQLLTSSHPDPP